MPYTLTPIQEAAFTGTFDFYKPKAGGTRPGTTRVVDDFTWGPSPDFPDVRGRITSTPDFGVPSPTGRVNEDYLDTTDRLRVHLEQEVEDGWAVQDLGSGQWYAVVGGPKDMRFRAMERWIYVKRITKPRGVA